jgi:hypothetical protein
MMTATLTPMTARDRAIAQLLEIRESAIEDLRTMAAAKAGSEWHRDRIRDIEYCNRQIDRLEASLV